jgi:aminoglycoside phosphotransferase (APT) family kinase protein
LFAGNREVIVHGDATPTNFLFQQYEVIGIDLEKMKYADRCWDLGFIAAELKHHFAWRMGNGWYAEPFIGHFLWEYTINYGDAPFFWVITRKIPFYMALALLRIARNPWLDEPYRKNLI